MNKQLTSKLIIASLLILLVLLCYTAFCEDTHTHPHPKKAFAQWAKEEGEQYPAPAGGEIPIKNVPLNLKDADTAPEPLPANEKHIN
ncbi:hypothetical protein ABK040_003388 [Willaertia magna]